MRVSRENIPPKNPERTQSTGHKPFGIIAVFMDLDHTGLTLHTYGRKRYQWEVPWIQNIRAYCDQQFFMDTIRQNAVFGSITFNEKTRRVRGSYRQLGLQDDEYYMHAEFINPEDFPTMGKNKHIAECLMQHYKNPNAPPILQLIVMDDDPRNIENLKHFDHFVRTTEPYCHEPRLQMIKFIPILVPKPEEVCNIGYKHKRPSRIPILKTETVCINGEQRDIQFTQEKSWTRLAFVQTLQHVTKEVLAFAATHPLPEAYKPKTKTQAIRPVDRRLRLTVSFGQHPTHADQTTQEDPCKLFSSL